MNNYLPDLLFIHALISYLNAKDIKHLRVCCHKLFDLCNQEPIIRWKLNTLATQDFLLNNDNKQDYILASDKCIGIHIPNYMLVNQFIQNVLCDKRNWYHKIKFLDLSHLNHLKNADLINIIPRLQSLHTIILSYTRVTDVKVLCNIPNIDLSFTQVKNITSLSQSRKLSLYGCKNIDDNSISAFCDNDNFLIEELDLSCTNITNKSVSSISTVNASPLISLSLRSTNVTNVALLQKLTMLRNLNLQNTYVSDIHMLTLLTQIDLQETNISHITQLPLNFHQKRINLICTP